MTDTFIIVYASALFELGKESGNLENIYNDLNECRKIFNDNPDLQKLLEAPTVDIKEKCKILSKIFEGIEEYVYNTICVLIEHKRIAYIGKITDDFNHLYDKHENIADVKVITTIPLNNQLRENLISKLSKRLGKVIRISEEINPKILGGIIIEYDGTVMDNSFQGKLMDISRELKKR